MQRTYTSILESHLEEIAVPFLRKLASEFTNLSPMERQIASLIKDGKRNKEISTDPGGFSEHHFDPSLSPPHQAGIEEQEHQPGFLPEIPKHPVDRCQNAEASRTRDQQHGRSSCTFIIGYNPSLIFHLLFILEVFSPPSDHVSETKERSEQAPMLSGNSSLQGGGTSPAGQTALRDRRRCHPKMHLSKTKR